MPTETSIKLTEAHVRNLLDHYKYQSDSEAKTICRLAEAWIREWDAHEPVDTTYGGYSCARCSTNDVDATGVEMRAGELCPARKRLAGVSDAAD